MENNTLRTAPLLRLKGMNMLHLVVTRENVAFSSLSYWLSVVRCTERIRVFACHEYSLLESNGDTRSNTVRKTVHMECSMAHVCRTLCKIYTLLGCLLNCNSFPLFFSVYVTPTFIEIKDTSRFSFFPH